MSQMSINDVIQQMRAVTAEIQKAPATEDTKAEFSFGGALKSAVDQVNDIQAQTGELREKFELGDPNVSLAEVMIASQKSSIAFQASVQVRNKLVQAYKDVMNMPI